MTEISVGTIETFADGGQRVFAIGRREIGVFRDGEKIVAYENYCPHLGGPVCQGRIFNLVEEALTDDQKSAGLRFSKKRNIVCPWHGFEFDLATGEHPGDQTYKLRAVPVVVRDGEIYLTV